MDSKQLLATLPSEMWDMILDNLEDPKDLENAYNTCRLWKASLVKKAPIWMLPKVLPNLINYLPKEAILNVRTVCKPWNKAVVKYLEEEQPSLQQVDETPFMFSGPGSSVRCLDVEIPRRASTDLERESRSMDNFLQQFGLTSEKNIFLSRSVRLHVAETTDLPKVLRIFQLHGHHIWSLSLAAWRIRRLPLVEVARFIWQLLGLAPNLRKLQLFADVDGPHRWHKEEVHALKLFLQENSALPPLVHLKALELDLDIKPIIQKIYAAYGQQLTSTSLNSWKCKYQLNTTFTELQKLTWSLSYDIRIDLNKVGYFKCPSLTHLYICLGGAYSIVTRYHSALFNRKLFSVIKKYSKTLQHLTINWRRFIEPIPIYICLPHLSEICLVFRAGNPSALSLTFLENLTNLKQVTLKFDKRFYQQTIAQNQRDNEEQGTYSQIQISPNPNKRLRKEIQTEEMIGKKIDLLYFLDEFDENTVGIGGGFKRPYGSNIWRFIPSLNIIVVQVYEHTGSNISTRSEMYLRKEYNAQVLAAKSYSF